MASGLLRRLSFFIVLTITGTGVFAQGNVPLGIHYQAVARDNFGNELVNKKISVKFSIISNDPLSNPVFQELHQDVTTSKFGVFSIVIGHGVATGISPSASLADINWAAANHYLKVEVKFGNDFMDMGTMQFLTVPYALYAQKSLEPGPAGPKGDPGSKGDPGDPASDKQTLSFDGSNLTISGSGTTIPLTGLLQSLEVTNDGTGGYNIALTRGNSINLATIEKDGDPKNELQDLTISSDRIKITNNPLATEWDLSPYRQSFSWDPSLRILNISGVTTPVNLSELKDDADASITNEIQDLIQIGDSLKLSKNIYSKGVSLAKYNQQLTLNPAENNLYLTNSTPAVSLSKYLQTLSFDDASYKLYVSNVVDPVDLSILKNDADSSPTNEIQDLSYNSTTRELSLLKSSALPINLTELKNDADADPTNELQDLELTGNTLKITGKSGATPINLATYLDDTDKQTLTYNEATNSLLIDGGNTVSMGSMVAFRARKVASETGLNQSSDYNYTFIEPIIDYNDGLGFDGLTGIFTAPKSGIYTFVVGFLASGTGGARELKVAINDEVYEIFNSDISSGSALTRSLTMKLVTGDKVKVLFNRGMATESGTGSFSGFKVY